jgi:uncharacterized protein
MHGSGGTQGGVGKFLMGFGLSLLALYLFFDSVQVSTDRLGLFSGWAQQFAGGPGLWTTTSMGFLFVPFFLGVLALFYDARQTWAWVLMWFGIAVLVIEILSRIHFLLSMKLTHLLGMMVLFAAGVALMIRSYRDEGEPPAATGQAEESGAGEGSEKSSGSSAE